MSAAPDEQRPPPPVVVSTSTLIAAPRALRPCALIQRSLCGTASSCRARPELPTRPHQPCSRAVAGHCSIGLAPHRTGCRSPLSLRLFPTGRRPVRRPSGSPPSCVPLPTSEERWGRLCGRRHGCAHSLGSLHGVGVGFTVFGAPPDWMSLPTRLAGGSPPAVDPCAVPRAPHRPYVCSPPDWGFSPTRLWFRPHRTPPRSPHLSIPLCPRATPPLDPGHRSAIYLVRKFCK